MGVWGWITVLLGSISRGTGTESIWTSERFTMCSVVVLSCSVFPILFGSKGPGRSSSFGYKISFKICCPVAPPTAQS